MLRDYCAKYNVYHSIVRYWSKRGGIIVVKVSKYLYVQDVPIKKTEQMEREKFDRDLEKILISFKESEDSNSVSIAINKIKKTMKEKRRVSKAKPLSGTLKNKYGLGDCVACNTTVSKKELEENSRFEMFKNKKICNDCANRIEQWET
jgi:predicted RND superfamily exporter protein